MAMTDKEKIKLLSEVGGIPLQQVEFIWETAVEFARSNPPVSASAEEAAEKHELSHDFSDIGGPCFDYVDEIRDACNASFVSGYARAIQDAIHYLWNHPHTNESPAYEDAARELDIKFRGKR
jgi:hypothetical protein